MDFIKYIFYKLCFFVFGTKKNDLQLSIAFYKECDLVHHRTDLYNYLFSGHRSIKLSEQVPLINNTHGKLVENLLNLNQDISTRDKIFS